MKAREAAQTYAVPAVLSPPSLLLATSGDGKVTFFETQNGERGSFPLYK